MARYSQCILEADVLVSSLSETMRNLPTQKKKFM